MNRRKIQLLILSAILGSIILMPNESVKACEPEVRAEMIRYTIHNQVQDESIGNTFDIDNIEYDINNNNTEVIIFKDPNFKKALNQELGKSDSADITIDELRSITGELDLEDRGISDIEGIKYLTNIEALNLNANHLTKLPESIGNLKSLQVLELDENNLECIPETIGNLNNLRELYISDNHLTELPESIGNLTNLEEFMAQVNNLKCLPNSIGNLENLRNLYLCDNKIDKLPKSLGRLNKLEVLSLKVNYISQVPKEILELENLRLDTTGNLIN
ncbi:MAG: leucine-rich repeat domain-containing protein [Clostridium sp.]